MPIFALANNEEIAEEINNIDVKNIIYEYELSTNANGTIDCIGTLSCTVEKIPNNCKSIILCYTKPHLLDAEPIIFSGGKIFPISANDSNNVFITHTDIRWGTYFRIRAIMEDGTNIYSPTYYINTYIEESDLNRILGQANIENNFEDKIQISVDNERLIVISQEPLEIYMTDINGVAIYQNVINGYTEFPLKSISPSLIILKIISNKSVFTKKILLKK